MVAQIFVCSMLNQLQGMTMRMTIFGLKKDPNAYVAEMNQSAMQ